MSRELKTGAQTDTCTCRFTVALFTTAKSGNNPMGINGIMVKEVVVFICNGPKGMNYNRDEL